MSVLVTAIWRHICYLLNIGGTFCFSLPEDLTVKDYFCVYLAFIFVGKLRKLLRDLGHAQVMRLHLKYVSQYFLRLLWNPLQSKLVDIMIYFLLRIYLLATLSW